MNPKAEAKRAKVGLALSKKLEAASEAMRQYRYACVDCGEPFPYQDDTRMTLSAAMTEYSGYLDSRFNKAQP